VRALRIRFLVTSLAGLVLSALPGVAGERVLTLGASVTETVYALGAGARVVARDDSSLYPPEVAELPSVGYFRTIGAEGVLSTSPDLIIAAEATGPAEQVALLRRAGIPLVEIADQPSAEALLAMVSRVGQALGEEAAAAALVARLEGELASLRAVVAELPRAPRITVLMGDGGSYSAAFGGTAADALIGLVGGVNVFEGQRGYRPVALEALVTAAPDFIFLTTRVSEGGGPRALEGAEVPAGLRATRAAREGRLWTLELGSYLVFGPRLPDHAHHLAERIALALPESP
jgi:iron complex transport system substrate-binding protein